MSITASLFGLCSQQSAMASRVGVAGAGMVMARARPAPERPIVSVAGERVGRREGQLRLLEGEREDRAGLPSWNLRREHGIECELPGGVAAEASRANAGRIRLWRH